MHTHTHLHIQTLFFVYLFAASVLLGSPCYFNFNYNCVLCTLHFLNLLLYCISLICTPLQSREASIVYFNGSFVCHSFHFLYSGINFISATLFWYVSLSLPFSLMKEKNSTFLLLLLLLVLLQWTEQQHWKKNKNGMPFVASLFWIPYTQQQFTSTFAFVAALNTSADWYTDAIVLQFSHCKLFYMQNRHMHSIFSSLMPLKSISILDSVSHSLFYNF